MKNVLLLGFFTVALMSLSGCSDDKDSNVNMPNPEMVGAWVAQPSGGKYADALTVGNSCQAFMGEDGVKLFKIEATGAASELKVRRRFVTMEAIGTVNALGLIALTDAQKDESLGAYRFVKQEAVAAGENVYINVIDQLTLSTSKEEMERVTTPTLIIDQNIQSVKKRSVVYSKIDEAQYRNLLTIAERCFGGNAGRFSGQDQFNQDQFNNDGRFDEGQFNGPGRRGDRFNSQELQDLEREFSAQENS